MKIKMKIMGETNVFGGDPLFTLLSWWDSAGSVRPRSPLFTYESVSIQWNVDSVELEDWRTYHT